MKKWFEEVLGSFFHQLGGVSIFSYQVIKTSLKTRGNLKPTLKQIHSISSRSAFIVIFSGIFIGSILVLQFNLMLLQYDAQYFLGGLNSSAIVRDVGPLFISFILAGKIGAFTAAELGTMRVTEQIDAIECLGTDSIQYLIVPRFFGIIISSFILLILGLTISILGSMWIASLSCGVNSLRFAEGIPRFISIHSLLGGLLKSTVYTSIVAAVSCYQGFTARGGAKGVGKAVTLAAIYTNLFIVIANFIVTYCLEFFTNLFYPGSGV